MRQIRPLVNPAARPDGRFTAAPYAERFLVTLVTSLDRWLTSLAALPAAQAACLLGRRAKGGRGGGQLRGGNSSVVLADKVVRCSGAL